MDHEFRIALDRRLRDSRIAVQTLVSASLLQDDLLRSVTKQKIEAHQERIKCIEKLLKIEDFFGELGPNP
jgi:hypothetical protein